MHDLPGADRATRNLADPLSWRSRLGNTAGAAGTNDAYPGLTMLDVVFILVTTAFFALTWAYVVACERV